MTDIFIMVGYLESCRVRQTLTKDYLILRAFLMGIHWYCIMLGRTYTFHLPTPDNIEEFERRTNPNLKIRGRIVLNYWKIARNELALRTTTLEGTVGKGFEMISE